jgi:hypothetical protein
MYYEHEDDDFLQRVDVEDFEAQVDWLQNIVAQVIPMSEGVSVDYAIIDAYDAEVWIEGGRFETRIYDVDIDDLFKVVQATYPDYDWEV